MRTTINLAEDALIAARNIAQRERMSLGEAVSELIRRGCQAGDIGPTGKASPVLRGRFALLPVRGETVTPQHVRDLLEREDR